MFQIVSDGCCDFNEEEVKKYGVDIVPFYITFDESNFLKEGIDISKEDFYNRLVTEKNILPKTSQPNPQDYIDIYTPYLKDGKDIISLTVSSKLSGSHNSALIAVQTLKEEYPDRTIVIIDSLNASIGQGLILREIIKMRDAGYTLDKAVQTTETVLKTTKVYFTVDSLEYLKKGGRLGPTTAFVSGILGLRPILRLDDEGQVSQLSSVRGKKKVLKILEDAIVDVVKDDKQNINLSIGHALSVEDATTLKANIEKALDMKITNPLTEVGAALGVHTGPGLTFAYCKKYESL